MTVYPPLLYDWLNPEWITLECCNLIRYIWCCWTKYFALSVQFFTWPEWALLIGWSHSYQRRPWLLLAILFLLKPINMSEGWQRECFGDSSSNKTIACLLGMVWCSFDVALTLPFPPWSTCPALCSHLCNITARYRLWLKKNTSLKQTHTQTSVMKSGRGSWWWHKMTSLRHWINWPPLSPQKN